EKKHAWRALGSWFASREEVDDLKGSMTFLREAYPNSFEEVAMDLQQDPPIEGFEKDRIID
ncbi:hypothetical protein L195_g035220, partial [Trifolium pratense]